MRPHTLLILAQCWITALSLEPFFRTYETLEDFQRNQVSFANANNTLLENGLQFNCSTLKVVLANSFKAQHADQVRFLNLSGKSIGALEVNAFSGLSCLYSLDLSRNEIANLSSDVFNGLESLEHLNLSLNALFDLTDEAFVLLSNLRVLDLSHNVLRNICTECFDACSKLETLVLSYNDVRYLNQYLLNLKHLRHLHHDHNSMAIINTSNLRKCRRLQYLDLSENQAVLLRIPDKTLYPEYLQTFNISNNYLLDDYNNLTLIITTFASTSTVIDLNENQFSCNLLSRYMKGFKAFKVNISPGRNFTAFRHVNGITCDLLNITEIKDPDFKDFLNSRQNKSRSAQTDESADERANSRQTWIVVVFSVMGAVVCACLMGYFIFKRKTRFYFTNIATDSVHLTREH